MIPLNRYTTLPVLLHMLSQKKLVLLDPVYWDDRNDAEILLRYKELKNFKELFALCFSHGETVHHWKTFANGISGCCIRFNSDKLIELLRPLQACGVRYGTVKYRKIIGVDTPTIKIDDIPFTKRWPYRCEEEFRIIWGGTRPKTTSPCYEIPFDPSIISEVTISQQMPDQVYDAVCDSLQKTFNCLRGRMSHSTLYSNKIWINKFKKRV